MPETTAETVRIRELNDAHRTGLQPSGKVLITQGVQAEGSAFVQAAGVAVRAFSDFTPDNDPYGTHDFGAVDVFNRHLFWKIDYYDQSLQWGSPDPADPAVTCRVLTIMLAEEY